MRRHQRRSTGRGAGDRPGGEVLSGLHSVVEALRSGRGRLACVYLEDRGSAQPWAIELKQLASANGVRCEVVDRQKLDQLAVGVRHQGVAALIRQYEYASLEEVLAARRADAKRLVVFLDSIQDPHNLGAILRSVHGFGATGVVIPRERAVGVTPVVVRSSAGAAHHVPIAQVVNLSRAIDEAKEDGFWVLGLDMDGAALSWSPWRESDIAIVVGSEGEGIRPGVLSRCDERVTIPITGTVGSLNASVAASVILYELARQRSGA